MRSSGLTTLAISTLLLPAVGLGEVGRSHPVARKVPLDLTTESLPSGPRAQSHLRLDSAADLQLTLGGLMGLLGPKLIGLPEGPELPATLRPRRLNSLDRSVIGNHSPAAETLSDVLLWTHVGLPYLALSLDHLLSDDSIDGRALAADSLVLLETFALNVTVTSIFKMGFRRARPYAYDPRTTDAERNKDGATLSFFSGHTSTVFAMATSYSYLYGARHPNSPWRWPIWLGSHALATTTAVMRVVAGKHFWSDVIVGAAAGSAIGLLVPFLHREHGSGPKLLARLRVTPVPYSGGWGVNAMMFW